MESFLKFPLDFKKKKKQRQLKEDSRKALKGLFYHV